MIMMMMVMVMMTTRLTMTMMMTLINKLRGFEHRRLWMNNLLPQKETSEIPLSQTKRTHKS